MKVLITGANGQLGNEIRELAAQFPHLEMIFTDVAELDITNPDAVTYFLEEKQPEAIVNCAAYTAVDKAESDFDLCARINIQAPEILARAAARYDLILLHVSTDFVFDGHSFLPYTEKDVPNPLSAYGHTKLDGEKEVLKHAPTAAVFRTAWLYSPFGNNFVKTMRRLARERGKLTVIYDQVGTPTYARDLAFAMLTSLNRLKHGEKEIYHYSNEGVASWYDFAHAICELSGIPCEVLPIETKDYPTPARRPHYSVLNKDKVKKTFGISIPHWRDALKDCLKRLKD